MALNFSQYKTGFNPRPDSDIDPKNKDAKWCADWARYILSYGMKTSTTPYSQAAKFTSNRLFSAGRQDPDQYLRQLSQGGPISQGPISQTDTEAGKVGKSAKRNGYMNVKKDILPIFPKYLSLLIGKYSAIEHEITANACDPKSGSDKENLKWTGWFESKHREEIEDFYKALGSEPQFESSFMPESIEEMEFFDSLGGNKLKIEIVHEILIKHSFDVSNWSDTIKRKIFQDLIEINIAAVKEYFDLRTNKVKAMYLDPANLIVPKTREDEYSNPEFHGYVRMLRAADLKLHGFSEDDIRTFSRKFAGQYGNSMWDDVELFERDSDSTLNAYDDFLIPTLECEWESTDEFYDQIKPNKKGQSKIVEEFYDTGKKMYNDKKYQNRPDRKVKKTRVINLYKCSWIIDTDHVFSYGRVYDTVRADNEVKSCVHVFKLSGQSILERTRPNLDNIQIAWLKFQNAIALASPPGVAVEFDALNNISTGMAGETFHPLEILRLKSDTGNLIYKLTAMGMGGALNRGNSGKPIEELQGGLGNALSEFNDTLQINVGMIQNNTGVNATADASNPDPKQSVRGSEYALVATNNTLKPLYDGYLFLKSRTADNFTYRIQLAIKQNPDVYKAYYPVIGKAKLKALSVGANLAASSMGIKIGPAATDEMKADIKEQIKISMQVGREGQSSINLSTGTMLLTMIESGQSLKHVSALLQYFENKEKKRQQKIQESNIAMQGDEKRKSDQAAAELARQAAVEAHERSKELIILEQQEKRKTDKALHEYKLVENEESDKEKQTAI